MFVMVHRRLCAWLFTEDRFLPQGAYKSIEMDPRESTKGGEEKWGKQWGRVLVHRKVMEQGRRAKGFMEKYFSTGLLRRVGEFRIRAFGIIYRVLACRY